MFESDQITQANKIWLMEAVKFIVCNYEKEISLHKVATMYALNL